MNEVPELFYLRLADVVMPLWRLSYEEQLKVDTQLKSSLLHSVRVNGARLVGTLTGQLYPDARAGA